MEFTPTEAVPDQRANSTTVGYILIIVMVLAVAAGTLILSGALFGADSVSSHDAEINLAQTPDGLFINYGGPPPDDDDTIIIRGPQGTELPFDFSSGPTCGADGVDPTIEEYAATDGSSETPTPEDYEATGVVGVDGENVGSINGAIANVRADGADTCGEVQEIVDDITGGTPPSDTELCNALGDDIEGETVDVIYSTEDGEEILGSVEIAEGACTVPGNSTNSSSAEGDGEVDVVIG